MKGSLQQQPQSTPTLRLESQLALRWPQPFAPSVSEKLVVMRGMNREAVAQYRSLATALQQIREKRPAKSVLVTSATSGAGKTLTATNLAMTLSETQGHRTLLVDANLSRPGIHQVFQVSARTGLIDLLGSSGGTKLPLIEVTNKLALLPAGRAASDSSEILGSARIGEILQEACGAFDWIIVDSEPLNQSSFTSALAARADLTVVVVDARSVKEPAVERAIDALGRDRIAGIVINRAK
jgi:capsular exopolysaccharide synthesis family protein